MYSFPLLEHETVLKKDHASLTLDDNSFTGALYLTNERLVFVGYILDIKKKYLEEVMHQHIYRLDKEKTFYLFPNVLIVETIHDKVLKFVVKDRDSWYEAIQEQIR